MYIVTTQHSTKKSHYLLQNNVKKTEMKLTTQTETQQSIVQTCIVHSYSEIEEAWTFAM
jgi:hypothetical protein